VTAMDFAKEKIFKDEYFTSDIIVG